MTASASASLVRTSRVLCARPADMSEGGRRASADRGFAGSQRRGGLNREKDVAVGYSARSHPNVGIGIGWRDLELRRLGRRLGDSPWDNKWNIPPFRFHINFPWSKWNIKQFQPFHFKTKPAAAQCPVSWMRSGLAEKVLFMRPDAQFAFILDTFRPIVARALEGHGYMFSSTQEYDAFHFGEDANLKRTIVGEMESFMQLRLPPWSYMQVQTVMDLVHWYMRRITVARPWFEYDIPDGWRDVIDDYTDVTTPLAPSMWRSYLRDVSPSHYWTMRRVHSSEPDDWESDAVRQDRLYQKHIRYRKSAGYSAPGRSKDESLWQLPQLASGR
eukprot:TRINITY_DN55844_c0_g1_i1.p1 TRINITY_DN55844_c0_g1~~TRINITY_DN55844_c0_g1_i1.p1  ORF type:complete len:329 (-),score=47.17 TRINITY_DN55844_c0_g1_i1:127-1113(-)